MVNLILFGLSVVLATHSILTGIRQSWFWTKALNGSVLSSYLYNGFKKVAFIAICDRFLSLYIDYSKYKAVANQFHKFCSAFRAAIHMATRTMA